MRLSARSIHALYLNTEAGRAHQCLRTVFPFLQFSASNFCLERRNACVTVPRMSPTGPAPQFGTAEYASTSDTCKSCKQVISGEYYRINGALACSRCAREVQGQMPKDTHAAYVRGIIFGIGAAILGFVIYTGSVIISGLEIAYISLAVGFLIGKAMKMGSGGIGGRRYQIAAAALTYAAVSVAAIPIVFYHAHKSAPSRAARVQNGSAAPGAQQATPNLPAKQNSRGSSDSEDEEVDTPGAKPPLRVLQAVGRLVLLGLASPFLGLQDHPFHGLIGLVILFVGVRIAWQLTAGPSLQVIGPFEATSLPSAAS